MPKAIIKISYTQVIDSSASSAFEKKILELSYSEYKMKQQTYNLDGTITRFTALKAKDGRANSLHYKSGFAVGGLIQTLKNKIRILQDGMEQDFVFDTYRFEVLESDTEDASVHKVAIHYMSGYITLYEVVGEYLVVASGDKTDKVGEPVETYTVKMQAGMSIVSYQELERTFFINQLKNIGQHDTDNAN